MALSFNKPEFTPTSLGDNLIYLVSYKKKQTNNNLLNKNISNPKYTNENRQMSHNSDSTYTTASCIPLFKILRWDWLGNWREVNFSLLFWNLCKTKTTKGQKKLQMSQILHDCAHFLGKDSSIPGLRTKSDANISFRGSTVPLIVWTDHFGVGMNRQITLTENLTGYSLWPWKRPVSSLALAHIPVPLRDERGLSGWFMRFL